MPDALPRLFWDLVGVVLAVAGCVLLGWSGIAYFNPGWGFESASLALSYLDLAKPGSFVRAAMSPGALLFVALAGVAMLAIGSNGISDLVGEEDSGDVELGNPPARVGGRVEGRLWLEKRFEPGTKFLLELRSSHTRYASGEKEEVVAFSQAIARESANGANGSFLPFAFEVPATAPPSDFSWRWRLGQRRDRWFSGYEYHALTLGPASEEQLRAAEAVHPAEVRNEMDAIGRGLSTFGTTVMPHDRARIAAMPPKERKQMRNAVDFSSDIVKVFLVISALIFVAVMVTQLFGAG